MLLSLFLCKPIWLHMMPQIFIQMRECHLLIQVNSYFLPKDFVTSPFSLHFMIPPGTVIHWKCWLITRCLINIVARWNLFRDVRSRLWKKQRETVWVRRIWVLPKCKATSLALKAMTKVFGKEKAANLCLTFCYQGLWFQFSKENQYWSSILICSVFLQQEVQSPFGRKSLWHLR